MPAAKPPEFRRRALDLVGPGEPVDRVAKGLGAVHTQCWATSPRVGSFQRQRECRPKAMLPGRSVTDSECMASCLIRQARTISASRRLFAMHLDGLEVLLRCTATIVLGPDACAFVSRASYIARYDRVMVDLRSLRLQAGLTQAQLAARSGVPQPNIAAYERGRRQPSPATSARLESALRPSARNAVETHRDMIGAVLREHGMKNPRVFGSVALHQDGADSDVDLLVDAGPDLDLLDIIDAATELEALLGRGVDIVTSRSLRPGHEILRTAVPL